MRVTGSAGPFNIVIPGTNITFEDVEGDLLVPTLCSGDYTLLISPSRFPGCATSLSLTVPISLGLQDNGTDARSAEGIGPDAAIKDRDKATDSKSLEIYPNPTRGQLTMVFHSMEESPIELSIFSESGRKVFFQQLPTGTTLFSLDLSHLNTASYFVVARQQDGTYLQKILVIKS